VITGCGSSPPIQPANKSKSGFGVVYSGRETTLSTGTPGAVPYRVFEKGATGFVPQSAERDSAQQRAEDFCKRKGLQMEAISERDSTSFPMPGKFPKAEIVFDCIPGPMPASADTKYIRLTNLKKLLDTGVITQSEFDTEKTKILSAP
jgi:hypothetical protein